MSETRPDFGPLAADALIVAQRLEDDGFSHRALDVRVYAYALEHAARLEAERAEARAEVIRLREGISALLARIRPGSEAAPWVVEALAFVARRTPTPDRSE
jgi:hypothetical protein